MIDKIIRMAKVSRPVFWLIAPSAYLFGVFASGHQMDPIVLFQAFLLSFPLGIYVFGINDLFDIESDQANERRKGEIWGARIVEGDRGWIMAASVMVIAALVASAIWTLNLIHIAAVLLFLPFPFLYSSPPIRLKSRPLLDSLSNATYTYAPFAMGFSLGGTTGFLDPNMILFALVFSAAHAIGTIMDLDGDRKAGIRTFAAVYGPRAAAAFAIVILVANLPFLFHRMISMFLVVLVYLAASIYVFIKPQSSSAKSAFVAMNVSLILWLGYAFFGYALGLYKVF